MTPGAAEGPVAVVTGAASGIGASCAGLMRRSGWRTAGIDLNPSDTDLPLRADVSDRAAVAGAVGQVIGRLGRIDLGGKSRCAVPTTPSTEDACRLVVRDRTGRLDHLDRGPQAARRAEQDQAHQHHRPSGLAIMTSQVDLLTQN